MPNTLGAEPAQAKPCKSNVNPRCTCPRANSKDSVLARPDADNGKPGYAKLCKSGGDSGWAESSVDAALPAHEGPRGGGEGSVSTGSGTGAARPG